MGILHSRVPLAPLSLTCFLLWGFAAAEDVPAWLSPAASPLPHPAGCACQPLDYAEPDAAAFAGIAKSEAWAEDAHAPATDFGPVAAEKLAGPIGGSPREATGTLSGKIVFAAAGHGWTFSDTSGANVWYTQRGITNSMIEDMGNLDQLTFFTEYLLNAGATVVAMRPVGFQDNEVVVDNDDPATVYAGTWSNSSSTIFYGTPGDVAYRFAATTNAASPTATARFAATIPETGFYPVYVWSRGGDDRVRQQYIVEHSGGATSRRIDHRRVGNGWIYLGNFHFETGGDAAVTITNQALAGDTGVVIADAVRFGNGMGDIDRGFGVSGYRRQDEASRYWVQEMLGRGQSASIYDSSSSDQNDNVSAPPRMAANMNRETVGPRNDRVFLSFHSNAGGSRGADGLYCSDNGSQVPNGNNTTNCFEYAAIIGRAVNEGMYAASTAPGSGFDTVWSTRGIPGGSDDSHRFGSGGAGIGSYGELSLGVTSNEFDATIIEVAFHDNASDAAMMRDPRSRNAIARASLHGIIAFFSTFGGGGTAKLPEPPPSVRIAREAGGQVVLRWSTPPSGFPNGDAATGYVVYVSENGHGFGEAAAVAGGASTSLDVTSFVPAGETRHFRVAATNAGGESFASPTVSVRRDAAPAPILVVNGFDRFERSQAVRESASQYIGGAGGGGGAYDRVRPSRINTFDYCVQAGQTIDACGLAFDSCGNEHVASGAVALGGYDAVVWLAGEESTADDTFNAAEQTAVTNYMAGGGRLFVSGSELGWDLDSQNNGRTFYRNTLRALFSSDSAATYDASGESGSIFEGIALQFDDGAFAYNVESADVIAPNSGSVAAMRYDAVNRLDGFESQGSWQDPNFSGSTNADAASTFTIASSPVLAGSGSGRLHYVWGAGSFIRTFNNANPTSSIEIPASSNLRISVFGDGSGHNVRICVRDVVDNELFATAWTTLDFTGWQEIAWNDIKNNPQVRFAGSGDNAITGTIVRIDSIQMQKVTAVDTGDIHVDELLYEPLGAAAKVAAVQWDGGAAKLVHMAIPFETISGDQVRTNVMARVLDFFDLQPVPASPGDAFMLY